MTKQHKHRNSCMVANKEAGREREISCNLYHKYLTKNTESSFWKIYTNLTIGFPDGNSISSSVRRATLSAPTTTPGRSLKFAPCSVGKIRLSTDVKSLTGILQKSDLSNLSFWNLTNSNVIIFRQWVRPMVI